MRRRAGNMCFDLTDFIYQIIGSLIEDRIRITEMYISMIETYIWIIEDRIRRAEMYICLSAD